MSVVANNSVVTIAYKLTSDEGEGIDSGDLEYLHGHQNIVPGLESELTGLKAGDSKKVKVLAADGYGEYNEDMVQLVPHDAFPKDQKIEVGMHFESRTDEGIMSFVVVKTQEDGVVLDANHPLAGRNLNFDITIKSLRPASDEEIAHGHAHGAHGHHH